MESHSVPTIPDIVVHTPVSKIGVGLTLKHLEGRKEYSLLLQGETSFGNRNQYILSGSLLNKYNIDQQTYLNDVLTQHPGFLETTKLCNELNLGLQSDKASIYAHYGHSREDGKIDMQTLTFGGNYKYKDRNIYGNVGLEGKENLKLHEAELGINGNIGTKVPLKISSSIKYDVATQRFIPTFSVAYKF